VTGGVARFRRAFGLGILLLAMLGLGGCSSTETVPPAPAVRSQSEPAPALTGATAATVVPATGGPASAKRPPVSASPYFFMASYLGRWQWPNDPTFLLTFNERNQVEYGPFFRGVYRMIDERTIELNLTGHSGNFVGKKVGPILFRLEFFENGSVMVLRQGDQAIVLNRLQ
jgi:hypothetical protein